MTEEPFWDELGIAWQAAAPAATVPPDRMKAHFRTESRLLLAAIAACMVVGTAMLALAVFTFWQAWQLAAWNFGTRGLALLIIGTSLWLIVRALWPVRGSDNARSLSDFADLGFARSAQGLRVCALSFGVCVAAAVLGVIGAVLRTMAGHPPVVPVAAGLALVAVLAGGVAAERRRFRREQARFAYLREALRHAD
ncbi:MAG TPA: hypothetical protein VIC34_13280 [Croceibacterium sp.]|jgi:hypothetical protein